MKDIAWRSHECSLFIQTFKESFAFTEKKKKETEDDGLTHTLEDLIEFRFLGFIVYETEEKEFTKEEEDEEGKEEKKKSSFTPPPSLLLELESLGFVDGDKKEIGEEKKEPELQKKQEEEDDDGYVLIQTPEEELELGLLDFFIVERISWTSSTGEKKDEEK